MEGLKELWVDIDRLSLAVLPQDELAFLPAVQVVDLSFKVSEFFRNTATEIFCLGNSCSCLIRMINYHGSKSVYENLHIERNSFLGLFLAENLADFDDHLE